MGVKEFYEKMYGGERTCRLKRSFLHPKLKRFELYRDDLAFENLPGGKRVLEVGCGDGELLIKLKSKYQEVCGIDISKPRIDRIKRKIGSGDNIHVRVEDINQRLNFEDKYFDTITMVAVLQLLFDPHEVLKECSRLLCKGGTLLVQVHNITYLPYRIRLLFGNFPKTSGLEQYGGVDGDVLHHFTRLSLKRLFEEEGFEVVKITSGGIFARTRRICGALLGDDILIVAVKK